MILNDPILIASAPRSGSSMTAGILDTAGVFTGITKRGDEYNRKGYYENLIIDEVLGEYLKSCDKDNQGKKFQPLDIDEKFHDFRDLILDLIESEGPTSEDWLVKSTKTAICRHIWRANFPSAKWVICRRERQLVVESMMRTPFMNAYDDEDNWNQMLNRYEYYFRDLIDRCDAHEFNVDAAVNGSTEEIGRLLDYCEIDYSPVAAQSFIDRRLIRAKNKVSGLRSL